MSHYSRYIGIDNSGAATTDFSCKGIRCSWSRAPANRCRFQPPPSPRRYRARRDLAEWLRDELDRDSSTIVGIDQAFSFPLAYFEKYRLSSNWQSFLVDFHHHWPTDASHDYVSFIWDDPSGRGLRRTGERSLLRGDGEVDADRKIGVRVWRQWRRRQQI